MQQDSRTTHTPGPWYFDGDNDDGRIGIYAGGADGAPMVADTWGLRHYKLPDEGCHNISESEEIANANLIAAAPDLLAACEELVSDARALGRDWEEEVEGMWPDLLKTIENAIAAIAKARGEVKP